MNALYFVLAIVDLYLFKKAVNPKVSLQGVGVWLAANCLFFGIFILSKG